MILLKIIKLTSIAAADNQWLLFLCLLQKVINLKGEKEMIDFEVRENDVMLKAKDNVIKKSDPFGSLFLLFLG